MQKFKATVDLRIQDIYQNESVKVSFQLVMA